MSKTFRLFASALVGTFMLGSAYAAGTFEGEVSYKLTMKNDAGTMDYYLKGKKMRVETVVKGHPGTMIIDLGTRQTLVLMPEQKMYMTMAIPEKKAAKSKAAGEGKITKTGKTAVILGYKCEEWLYESKHGQTSIWASAGLGNFMGLGQNGMNDPSSSWMTEVRQKGLFPLKTVTKTKEGGQEMTMEAVKVDKKSLPASLFEAPADYKKMDMGGVGDMMKGILNGAGK